MKNEDNRTQQQKILSLFKEQGILRTRDLEEHKLPRQALMRLVEKGMVEKIGGGIYRLVGAAVSENQTIIEVCKSVPFGTVCLLSALRFHKLTTQSPQKVWIAIPVKAWTSTKNMPVNFVYFSGQALSEGVEEHSINGVIIKVYSKAKTVADLFKYRNKIGLDIAIEALAEYRKQSDADMDKLWYYAGICKVRNIIKPYLEAAGT